MLKVKKGNSIYIPLGALRGFYFLKDHPVAVEKAKRGKWNSLDTT